MAEFNTVASHLREDITHVQESLRQFDHHLKELAQDIYGHHLGAAMMAGAANEKPAPAMSALEQWQEEHKRYLARMRA